MRIALDAMGGDFAPHEIVRGALLAQRFSGVDVILVGEEEKIRDCLGEMSSGHAPRIQHASEQILMHEAPALAVRKKRDSSIAVCCDLIKRGEADAMVSAGNTGAVMATALLKLGRTEGIDRPAIGTVVPTRSGKAILLDVGACVDCEPKNLLQFALMGAVYAEKVLGIQKPRVGLMSIGEEETKGNELTRAAFREISATNLNFRGNVEGRDVFHGQYDVIVCDGFLGNVVLKVAEGAAEFIMDEMKDAVQSSWLTKLPMLFVRRSFRGLKRKLDYAEYGGAPLLGIDGVCIVSHGRSHARAIANAVLMAKYTAEQAVVSSIRAFQAQIARGEARPA